MNVCRECTPANIAKTDNTQQTRTKTLKTPKYTKTVLTTARCGNKNIQKHKSRISRAFIKIPADATLTANLLEEVVMAHIDDADDGNGGHSEKDL